MFYEQRSRAAPAKIGRTSAPTGENRVPSCLFLWAAKSAQTLSSPMRQARIDGCPLACKWHVGRARVCNEQMHDQHDAWITSAAEYTLSRR